MSDVPFLNAHDTIIDEYMSSHTLTENVSRLKTRSQGDAGGRVLIRSDWSPDNGKVAVLSGSGSGHEPAHMEYIGKGHLAGCIQGEIFASPSVGAVEQAIDVVTGPAGCLLIVMDYTGDRLHFGLAAERARAKGQRVEMVLIGDDIAFWGKDDHPRGLAGTVLVQKLAGYLAEKGESLETITKAVKEMAGHLRTLALATSHANVPGKESSTKGEPALGMGIHNEPGARNVDVTNATDAVKTVLSALEETLEPGFDKYVMLLNDLGGCSVEERAVLTNHALQQFGIERVSHFIGPATFITSCDMHGFSITLLPAKPEYVEAFVAPSSAAGWPRVREVHKSKYITAPSTGGGEQKPEGPVEHSESNEKIVLAIANTLIAATKDLNDLDALSGDGDTGDTYAAGAQALKKAIEAGELPSKDPSELSLHTAELLEDGMGGTSGILGALIFTTASKALKEGDSWSEALVRGVENMKRYSGSKPGNRTILDALTPALDALSSGGSLEDAAKAARKGAEATKSMRATVGRAAHVPQSSYSGHVDAGAEAIARIFETLSSS